ncbi:MAG: ABC transporter permease [Treponema sp.]|nr:ABC transporter permease [Treponema sp.]
MIFAVMGFDPVRVFGSLINGAVGNRNSISETLVKATPLIFMALSFAVSVRCGIFNLGANGQLYIGAIAGTLAGTGFPFLPPAVHIPLMLLTGIIGGGLYGALAGWLRNQFGVNELIATIMLNNIAVQVTAWCVAGPMKDPLIAAVSTPQSALLPQSVKFPVILPGTRLHAGLLVAVLVITAFYFFLWKTAKGYEMRVVGLNPQAARYAGMNVKSNHLLAMFLAGALAGMGGCVELMSVQGRLISMFAGEIGFDGVAVSLLGANTPGGIAAAALLFGMLSSGANKMQMLAKVPNAAVFIMKGLIILFVVGRELFSFGITAPERRKPVHRADAA